MGVLDPNGTPHQSPARRGGVAWMQKSVRHRTRRPTSGRARRLPEASFQDAWIPRESPPRHSVPGFDDPSLWDEGQNV